jgi:drug/metabolite transporter (DMT)-like permease
MFLLAYPFLIKKGYPLFGDRKVLVFVRALLGCSALTLGSYALSAIPLADATVLAKTSVLFTVILSGICLREKITPRLFLLSIVGLVGTVFVLKPSFSSELIPGLAAVGQGLGIAIVAILIRKLHQTEEVLTIVAAFGFYGALLLALAFGRIFIAPTPIEWLLLLGIGITGTFGQLCYTRAYSFAPASHVQPFQYVEVLVAVLIGLLFWGEIPDVSMTIGAMMIVGCGLALMRINGARSLHE